VVARALESKKTLSVFATLTLIVGEVSPPEGTTTLVLVVVTVIVWILDIGVIMIGSELVGVDGILCIIRASVMLTVSERDLVN
jgi:hypothetical protein